MRVLVGNGCGHRPDGVPQANGRPLGGAHGKTGKVASFMDYWHAWVYLIEVGPVSLKVGWSVYVCGL